MGIATGDEKDQAYKKRNSKYIYKKILKDEYDKEKSEGWEKYSKNSGHYIKVKRLRNFASAFEDEVWCIFHRMGFSEMNYGSNFEIPRYDLKNVTKQIDVFAKDEQCVCIVECKAAETPHTKRVLDTTIDQMAAIRHSIELSIFSHYRDPANLKKIKVIWILAVKNIDISDNDVERANKSHIKIFDERQLEYYSNLASHFGKSAKYQFLSDLLPNIDIPDLMDPIPAIKGKMGKHEYYEFVMEPDKLLKIAYIAHRAKNSFEEEETYQRMANKKRLNAISKYITEENGIFPTNIVINIETDSTLRFDPAAGMAGKNAILGTLYLPNKYKTAWIIDGQHRLFAYSNLEEAKTATLPVFAFVNLDAETQANLFVDINGEQVRVQKNLLIDLWATLHWNSPNPSEKLKALSSKLVKELNIRKNSPLAERFVEIEGKRTNQKNITLTAITEEIRSSKLLGTVPNKKSKNITPGLLFLDDVDTTLIRSRDVLIEYFNYYINKDEKIKAQWDLGSGEGGYICSNGGLISLLRVLEQILLHVQYSKKMDISALKQQQIVELLQPYQDPICDFIKNMPGQLIKEFRGQYGEGGYKATTFSLLYEINKEIPSFEPPGLMEWIKSHNNENNPKAYELIAKFETAVMDFITFQLMEEFGNDISEWWHEGVPERIRVQSMQRAQVEGEYYHPEKFVDLIDWKEIVLSNFELLGDTFTFEAKNSDSQKKKVAWFEKLNEIRRIVSHPPRGGISDEQMEYLVNLVKTILPRLSTSGEVVMS